MGRNRHLEGGLLLELGRGRLLTYREIARCSEACLPVSSDFSILYSIQMISIACLQIYLPIHKDCLHSAFSPPQHTPINRPSDRRLFSPSPPSSTPVSHALDQWLYQLSALEPPKIHSLDFSQAKRDLQAMLQLVDSVKHFHVPSNQQSSHTPPDGRIFSLKEDMPIDWNSLVETQENFIKSRAQNIPGSRSSIPQNQKHISNQSKVDSQNDLLLEMATKGLHIFSRTGIGQQPQKKSSFYAVKLPTIIKN
ncbi:hypothetical protein O181_053610 [Austropuccinia psidii MF-1]|uniref:Uncharacterized protein n=1 Tax=Austropuccinia psidii MF-1 TaxID=1389203 RepID=A0A9Q3HTN2_9BASI|nr:hypothetical protein [Austropuccinia psidii MF-1]